MGLYTSYAHEFDRLASVCNILKGQIIKLKINFDFSFEYVFIYHLIRLVKDIRVLSDALKRI